MLLEVGVTCTPVDGFIVRRKLFNSTAGPLTIAGFLLPEVREAAEGRHSDRFIDGEPTTKHVTQPSCQIHQTDWKQGEVGTARS